MGWRGRGGRGGPYPGRGPFSELPPWQRPGWLYGYGAEPRYTVDPTKCARFPWMPRWWWANPDAVPYTGIMPTPEQEKQYLEQTVESLEEELESIKKRLEEIGEL